MNRMDRLLGIVLELQRRGQVRAEDLAAKFETSKRTIYRDVQALCETGVPVVAQAGVGYSLVKGYFLPPLSFTSDEAAMLLLGGEFMAQNFDAQYRARAQDAVNKIETVITDKLRAEVNELRASIHFVTPETLSAETTAELLLPLRRAIIERRTVRFRYHTKYAGDDMSAERVREADPYALLRYGESWYLIGYCHWRQEIRNFRMDRVSDLAVLDQSFEKLPGFKLEPPEEDQRRITVRVWFDSEVAPWVKESRSYYIDGIEEFPDGLLVTSRVRYEREALQWILSWGSAARVLEPETLKRRVCEEAQKILAKNSH
jgi:predicted DNA-binding transcriptional regulator YafY